MRQWALCWEGNIFDGCLCMWEERLWWKASERKIPSKVVRYIIKSWLQKDEQTLISEILTLLMSLQSWRRRPALNNLTTYGITSQPPFEQISNLLISNIQKKISKRLHISSSCTLVLICGDERSTTTQPISLLDFIWKDEIFLFSVTETKFYIPDHGSRTAIMAKFRAFMRNPDLFRTTFWTFPDF